MAAAFSLTLAETCLVEHLLAGCNLKESAAALGVATTTAKTHLEAIFRKTGVKRQAQLGAAGRPRHPRGVPAPIAACLCADATRRKGFNDK